MKKKKKPNGFEQRENAGPGYWKEPRWQQVRKLRKEGKIGEANSLVLQIRRDWGVE